MKKQILTLTSAAAIISGSILPFGHAHAATQHTAYDSNSTKFSQGYKEGGHDKKNHKIREVKINGQDKDYKDISQLSDDTLYKKASDDHNQMNAIVDTDLSPRTILPIRLDHKTEAMFNDKQLIDMNKFNKEFIKLTNKDRKAKHVQPIKYAKYLQKGTDVRSMEMAKHGDIRVNGKPHVRPKDSSSFRTAHPNIKEPQYRLGENIGLLSFEGNPYELVSEKKLAEKAYKGFKNSPGHYAQLMDKDYKHITNSIKIHGSKDKNAVNPDFDDFVVTSTFDTH